MGSLASPEQPPERRLARTLTKYALAVAIAAMAVYGAIRPEEEARRATRQVAAGYEEMAKRVGELQRWADASREAMATSSGACKAEVQAIQSYVAGYLLALGRTAPSGGSTSTALEALMRKMARERLSAPKAMPKLTPPAPQADILRKGY